MAEIKVGQKYTRVGSWALNSVNEVYCVVKGISEGRVNYTYDSGRNDYSRVEVFYPSFQDYGDSYQGAAFVLVEDVEELEPLKLEHLKVGQLVIRKSDGWQRFITSVEGEQVTHKCGRKKMGGENSQDASDFLENFRLPDISEVAQFKKDNPDLFAEYVFGEEPVAEEDAVNHPSHYTSDPSGVECIQITRHRNFNVGNAIKYLWRAGLKKSEGRSEQEKQIEDLKKAVFYIQDEIKRLES